MTSLKTTIHVSKEWTLRAHRNRMDPWGEIGLSAVMRGPDGSEHRLPLYWAGGDEWKLRVSIAKPGEYTLRTECSDPTDAGLQDQRAVLVAEPTRQESNPLFLHGPIGARKGSGFVHQDGTPFFWLGDTWWMLMSSRVRWPDDFRTLAQDRARKGFTVVQVVVGFPGDLSTDDARAGTRADCRGRRASGSTPRTSTNATSGYRRLSERELFPASWGAGATTS